MFCSTCGSALGAKDKFCPKCEEAISLGAGETLSSIVAIAPPISVAVPSTSFQDPTRLTQWLKYFLYAAIVTDAIGLFSNVLAYQFVSDLNVGVYSSEALVTEAAEINDNRQQIVGVLQFSISIATIVLFAMWIYRANFNARQLGAQGMKFSPGWSVGYYFIPILWFWKPYQAMKEIWCASKAPTSWEAVVRGTVLPWWWFFFLVSSMLGNASFRTTLRAEEIDQLLVSTGITIASDVAHIPATIISLILVRQIYEMQMSHVQYRI